MNKYSEGWLKWLGIGVLVTLALFCFLSSSHSWAGGSCHIKLINESPKAKIYYWVYWLNPTNEKGEPLRDYRGKIMHEMNIMGGELDPGENIVSGPNYKSGDYYLQWREASGNHETKTTSFQITPGIELYEIVIYSSEGT